MAIWGYVIVLTSMHIGRILHADSSDLVWLMVVIHAMGFGATVYFALDGKEDGILSVVAILGGLITMVSIFTIGYDWLPITDKRIITGMEWAAVGSILISIIASLIIFVHTRGPGEDNE